MADLSEAARAALERYRATEAPSTAQKTRLFAALQARAALGQWPAIDVAPPTAVPPSGLAAISKAALVKAVIGVGIATVAVIPAYRYAQRGAAQPARSAQTQAASALSRPAPERVAAERPQQAEKTAPPARSATERAKPSAVPSIATIDEEVRLLSEARTAQRAGNAAHALELLTRHAARYPNGKLSDAREVARILALCDLGRRAEARKEADQFLARHPQSAFAERVRRSCLAK